MKMEQKEPRIALFKLIPLLNFLVEIKAKYLKNIKTHPITTKDLTLGRVFSYTNLCNAKLEAWMFIPCCNITGSILKDPGLMPSQELEDYRKAKEKVLFVGFSVVESKVTKDKTNLFIVLNGDIIVGRKIHSKGRNWDFSPYNKVEDLVKLEEEIYLTREKGLKYL